MKTKLRAFVILICLVSQLVIGVGLAEGADPVHVVRRGDTLYSVARRYGTTVNAIMQANGLQNSNRIYVGQRLIVPTSATAQPAATSGTYVVQRGDTLSSIASRYGVSVQALARANNIYNPSLIRSGQRLVIPGAGATAAPSYSSSGSVHVVQRGENLYRIALHYGTTVQALASANNLSSTSLIRVGQTLVIPGGGSTSAAPSSSSVSAPTSGKWIDINLATQGLVAYEGQQAVYWATVSTGLSRTPTPKGRFRIYRKLRSATMSGPGYRIPNVPYVMDFYGNYSMHGTYWHNNFGQPMSHGCVNLRTSDAQWLYNWAPVGTLVVIH
ncbi:MAG: LysM peptidoglycan-binding domain-containing protein [Anaerolineae bacterium]